VYGNSYLNHHTLIYLKMVPKGRGSDAGSASKPKRSSDALSVSDKVKILDMIEIKKNLMRRLPGCVQRANLPFVK